MEFHAHLINAFKFFDQGDSGFITKSDLEIFFENQGLEVGAIEYILDEVSSNNEGKIDLIQFLKTLIDKCNEDMQICDYILENFDN